MNKINQTITAPQYSFGTKHSLSGLKSATVLLLAFCMGLVACQKEFTIEGGIDPNDGTQTGTAVFSVAGAPNACSVATLNGDFFKGTAVSDTCTVTISVNVADTGSYTISSNTTNGITFSASGKFTTTGNQTIQLIAVGTPAAAGIFHYTAGSKGCTFSVTCIDEASIPAEFTLEGSPTACTTDSVKGIYTAGLALDASNTVVVTANVTKAGAYTITTGTVNGITFSSSGRLALGTQTIVLKGSGTPTATGTNNYTAGTNGCSFPVTVVAPVPAVFTLSGAPAACSTPVINGVYQAGTPLSVTNTVTINVDVTTAGVFTITTNTVNGMTFSATGRFPAAGTGIPVTLIGIGKPEAAGTSTFTPSAGTSSCTFDIAVAAPSPSTYSCKVDGVLYTFTDNASADLLNPLTLGGPGFHTDGFAGLPNGNNIPEFQLFVDDNDNSNVIPGTYNVDGILKGYRIEIDFNYVNNDNSVTIWNTSSTLFTPNPPFTIVITSITSTRVTGTFSGQLTNPFEGSTGKKTITEGVFDLPLQ